jgi:hypothetical protein
MDRRDRERLGLKLQDVWGYFDTILGGDTFAPEGSKLRSKLRLYKAGHRGLLEATDMLPSGDRAHARALALPNYNELDDERSMNKYARIGRELARDIARRFMIDVRTSYLLEDKSGDMRRPRRQSRGGAKRRR